MEKRATVLDEDRRGFAQGALFSKMSFVEVAGDSRLGPTCRVQMSLLALR